MAGESETPSHAHARAIVTAPSVEERIDYIAGMMQRLEWVRGKSGKALAANWGLSLSTVEGNAAEAHRLVMADADEAGRNITVIATKAMMQAADEQNYQGIKAMGQLLLDVSGARAPNRQELTGKDGGPLHGPVIYVPAESDD